MSLFIFVHTELGDTVTRYMSCHRTEEDEHTRFLHFQLFCLILGIFSFIWVRRFRVVYASLFEQRKLSLYTRRPSDGDAMNGLELTNREEISPLNSLSNSHLEVV